MKMASDGNFFVILLAGRSYIDLHVLDGSAWQVGSCHTGSVCELIHNKITGETVMPFFLIKWMT